MPEKLTANENKEGFGVLEGLQSGDFMMSRFDNWLRDNAFIAHGMKGSILTYKGTYGFVQYEFVPKMGGVSKIVNCWYIPLSNKNIAYPLLKEGISIQGRSFSNKDIQLLKKYRYQQVEHIIKSIIENKTGTRPDSHARFGDLGLDIELDLPEVIMEMEDKFDCIIDDKYVKHFKTVKDLISHIRQAKGMLA